MPVLLLHQNMRVFGGGSSDRNAAFAGGFTAIGYVSASPYLAAGFTEITNDATSLAELPALAAAIDPGLISLVIIEVGISALGHAEYIAIAWNPDLFTISNAGQVLKGNLGVATDWRAYNTSMTPPVPAIGLPASQVFAADARGPAYIEGTYDGNSYLIMYFHNMFATGDRSGAYTNIPSMESKIKSILGLDGNTRTIIGGDFNLNPRDLSGLEAHAARNAAGEYIKTTWSNPYDFWLCSPNVNFVKTEVEIVTRGREQSDHAAIVLKID